MDFSKEGKEELLSYNEKICKQIRRLKKAFGEANPKKIQKVIANEGKYLNQFKHMDNLPKMLLFPLIKSKIGS
ncbi:MAG: hypothetical protein H8D67_30580 [Deltaproteobacteria bacterium]|nr:hypothetical protein [Deltaproteobacteria bacterium]